MLVIKTVLHYIPLSDIKCLQDMFTGYADKKCIMDTLYCIITRILVCHIYAHLNSNEGNHSRYEIVSKSNSDYYSTHVSGTGLSVGSETIR